MGRLISKLNNDNRRKNRVRAALTSSAKRPRLSVHISNRHVSAQIIDDTKHSTLAAASTVRKAKIAGNTLTDQAVWVGQEIAKKAKANKVKKVAFDRGSHLYHGRIKALAEAARKEGLEF